MSEGAYTAGGLLLAGLTELPPLARRLFSAAAGRCRRRSLLVGQPACTVVVLHIVAGSSEPARFDRLDHPPPDRDVHRCVLALGSRLRRPDANTERGAHLQH